MKSSLYFEIKLEKRILLDKLKTYTEKSKITQKKSHKIKIKIKYQTKQKYAKNKTKKNA